MLLFTDGLVERRGLSLRRGLARLQAEAASSRGSLDALCDHLLASLVEKEVGDDIAIIGLRPVPLAGSLRIRLPAEPHVLAPLRQTVRRWLHESGAEPEEAYDILVACGEACANAIQHPYGAREGLIEVELSVEDGEVQVSVRDRGQWRSLSPPAGGRGLPLMDALMDTIEVERSDEGTTVRMRRRLGVRDRERTRTS